MFADIQLSKLKSNIDLATDYKEIKHKQGSTFFRLRFIFFFLQLHRTVFQY